MNYSTLPFVTTLVAFALSVTIVQSKPIARMEPIARIVNGVQSSEGAFPYFVDLGNCGGALIAPDVIFFAAHCGNATYRQVNVGAYQESSSGYGSQARFCMEWVPHPMYGTGSMINYDFALCKLDRPAYIDQSFVQLEFNDDDSYPAAGDNLIVMGLGALAEGKGGADFLNNVTVPAVSNEDCNKPESYNGRVKEAMICAGFPEGQYDSCQGDSGGPLVKREYQNDGTFVDKHVGVVSWGSGCARENKYGVYARTSSAKDFIKETTCDVFESPASFCKNGPAPSPKCDVDLNVDISTDHYAFETNFTLSNLDTGELLTYRNYLVKNYENQDTICVKKNTCYQLEINDSYGDGLCAKQPCGTIQLGVNKQTFYQNTDFFGYKTTTAFCIRNDGSMSSTGPTQAPNLAPTKPPTPAPTSPPTPAPTSPPTPAPTSPPTPAPTSPPTPAPTSPPTPGNDGGTCGKDNHYNFQKKLYKKAKGCKKYIKGKRKKKRKKCRRKFEWNGEMKFAHEICPLTCGRVGMGRCARRRTV